MPRFLFVVAFLLFPLLARGTAENDSLTVRVMDCLFEQSENAAMEHIVAELYLKQRVEVRKKNLLVNFFPNMTRFDKNENFYLSEYLYKVNHIYGALPEARRIAVLSTFGSDDGEMETVLGFMAPQLCGEHLFNNEYLSPLSLANKEFYNYSLSSDSCSQGVLTVVAKPRYDNIQLFSRSILKIDETDFRLMAISVQGWNEQSEFSVTYHMSAEYAFLVDSIKLDIDYFFAGNDIRICADAVYDYRKLQLHKDDGHRYRKYDIGVGAPMKSGADRNMQMDSCRRISLTEDDSLFYVSKGVFGNVATSRKKPVDGKGVDIKHLLWRVGDAAISSHTLAWGDSDLKISPLINPSYLSYSSSKGVSYKLAMNMQIPFSSRHKLQIKPVAGYNFKYREMYWNLRGIYSFAPMRRAALSLDIGRGCSVYSSEVLDYIKNSSLDSLRFDKLPIVYYRDFHVKLDVRFEVLNGLELQTGVNLYRRSLYHSVVPEGYEYLDFARYYKRFAPHLRIAWHPGMYYYVMDGKKVNIGSRAPRFMLDVEQGVSGIFHSRGSYTRVELDIQYKHRVSSVSSLYMRAAAGGYFFTDDIYFVDYDFLKNDLLPLDKEDELSGAYQLLEREWYNSADRYISFNASFESPFLFVQRVMPRVRFIKNEALYANILFISHLCPYWECGYGVETPYANLGLFAGFERGSFLRFGYKVTFSLFKE